MHTQIIGRGAGRSIVAAIAYRAAEQIRDERLGQVYDYTRKSGVVHSEIMAPDEAPAWMLNRASLWNGVDAAERRRDAQTGREVRVALPSELQLDDQLRVLRNFIRAEFVTRGMVADFSVHHDNPNNPHAHIVLTTRSIEKDGFGKKCRDWNATKILFDWRESWANECNRALQRDGHDMRIDHRSHVAQGIVLEPTTHIGKSQARAARDVDGYVTQERLAEQDRIMRKNGDAIIADPSIALDAITRQRSTFTRSDVGRWLHARTVDAEQFTTALGAVMNHHQVIALGVRDGFLNDRFTTDRVQASEQSMMNHASEMSALRQHAVDWNYVQQAEAGRGLSDEQSAAVRHILRETDIAVVEGYAGTGKSRMLDAARAAWVGQGYHVQGAALSGKAAEGLQQSAGIQSRTLASLEMAWSQGYHKLTRRSVLVIDEAGMVGSQQMARVLGEVSKARAKVVLIGDSGQLQAIEAGAPLRVIGDLVGRASLEDIRRQKVDWQRDASLALARGAVDQGLSAYASHGYLHWEANGEATMAAMVRAWDKDRRAHPKESQVMLAFRRVEVAHLNALARDARHAAGELGHREKVQTATGPLEFSEGDRVYFCRNDRNLGVKNGSLGTIERLRDGRMSVLIDGEADRRLVMFDTRSYAALDYGYAATVHKAQGVTVERAYVFGSELYDRNVTNVAMTRHVKQADLFVSKDVFASREAVFTAMGRQRPKDMALDYDDVARSVDQSRRETAARLEVQRHSRESDRMKNVRQIGGEGDRSAGVVEVEEREARKARMATYHRFETERDQALSVLARGRVTPRDVWFEFSEVATCAAKIKHVRQALAEYSRLMVDFAAAHPAKAAMGLSPKIQDRYGLDCGERRLSEHLAAAKAQFFALNATWDVLESREDLRLKAKEGAQANNQRLDAEAKRLPCIEQALKKLRAQHEHDALDCGRDGSRERELLREPGHGLER